MFLSIRYHIFFLSSQTMIGEIMNERKQQQIKIAHILQDIGLDDELIEKMTSLKKEDYKIIAETTMNVEHALIGFADKISEIKVVRSHPQALAQCKTFLQNNFPDTLIEEATLSTSAAVRSLFENDKSIAAIGNIGCAKMYEIPVIE